MNNLFLNISDKNKEKLLKMLKASTVKYSKGVNILSNVNRKDYIGIVDNGSLQINLIDYEGNEVILDELEKNEKKHFTFDDEEIAFEEKQNAEIFEEKEEFDKEEITNKEIEETHEGETNVFQEQSILKNTTSIDPKRINELMDIINGNAEVEEENVTEKADEEKKEIKKDKTNIFIRAIYNLLISIIFVFVFMICRVILREPITSIPTLDLIVTALEKGYLKVIEILFGLILNSIHSIFTSVPTYNMFVYHNSYLSSMAVLCLFSIILLFIIISILKGIICLIWNDD